MGQDATRRTPRFNHVAMSVPADLLDERGRREICDFYDEVFGWKELPTLTEDRRRLVLQAHEVEQFVFIVADDPPMRAPRLDHFGLSVGTMEELDEAYERALAYREKDDRVEIVEKKADTFAPLTLTAFYVRYLLPMMVEIQHYEYHQPEAATGA